MHTIYVDSANTQFTAIDGVLYKIDSNRNPISLITYPTMKTDTTLIIPNTVTTIGDEAFLSCGKLETVVIPSSVQTIGMGAFNTCTKLTSVTIEVSDLSKLFICPYMIVKSSPIISLVIYIKTKS